MPGVIYGVDDDKNVLKVMVTVDTKEVKKQIRTLGRSFENTIHEIAVPIEGKPEPLKFQVVPRTTQFCARKFPAGCVAIHVYSPCNPLFFVIQLPWSRCASIICATDLARESAYRWLSSTRIAVLT